MPNPSILALIVSDNSLALIVSAYLSVHTDRQTVRRTDMATSTRVATLIKNIYSMGVGNASFYLLRLSDESSIPSSLFRRI